MPKDDSFSFYSSGSHYSFGQDFKSNNNKSVYRYANKTKTRYSFAPPPGQKFSFHARDPWWGYRNPKGITGATTFPAAKKKGVPGLDPKATKPYKKKLAKSDEDKLVEMLGGLTANDDLDEISKQVDESIAQFGDTTE